jgi:protein-S-isoprenylcysteine O-methyltransferase Ste14
MKDAKFALGLVAQLLAATVVFGVIVFWRGQWNTMRWVGLCIGVPALVGLFVARFQLGKSFAVTPQAKQLVTHGLYSKIRNPMYVFSGLLIVGFALATQLRPVFLFLVVLVPMQLIRARQESQILEQKFGDEYREYRKKTWF